MAAVEAGRGAGPVDYAPLLDRLAAWTDAPEKASSYPGPKDVEEMRAFLHSSPFFFSIHSPYSRIASRVRGYRDVANPPPPLTAAQANEELVVIRVSAKGPLETADEIKEVFVRRGATILRPLRSESHGGTTIREGDREKHFRDRAFTFPLEVFEPSSDVTIVLVGTRQTLDWTMAREELAGMR